MAGPFKGILFYLGQKRVTPILGNPISLRRKALAKAAAALLALMPQKSASSLEAENQNTISWPGDVGAPLASAVASCYFTRFRELKACFQRFKAIDIIASDFAGQVSQTARQVRVAPQPASPGQGMHQHQEVWKVQGPGLKRARWSPRHLMRSLS